MANINQIACVQGGANTGYGDCFLNFGTIAGAFLVPKGFQITPAQAADLQQTLQDAAFAATASERIYPIHNLEQITSNSEDKTVQTLGYGGKAVVREGDYDWTFQFIQGGFCLLKALRKFNGAGKYVLFYDSNGVLFGQKIGDNIAGIPLQFFWANPWAPNDGSNATIYAVQFVFKPKYANDELGSLKADFDLAQIQGLQNVVLKVLSGAAPAPVVGATTGCDGTNLYDMFASELAVVGNWKATNGATGADLTITSVAEDANASGWTVTVDAADPDYPVDGSIILQLADPQTLAAAGVTGFESLKLTIPVA